MLIVVANRLAGGLSRHVGTGDLTEIGHHVQICPRGFGPVRGTHSMCPRALLVRARRAADELLGQFERVLRIEIASCHPIDPHREVPLVSLDRDTTLVDTDDRTIPGLGVFDFSEFGCVHAASVQRPRGLRLSRNASV